MGRRPSAEVPGEDNGAILGNDQVGQVYANIRLVAENLDALVLVSDNIDDILAADANITATISAAVTTVNAEFLTTFTTLRDQAAVSAASALASKDAAALSVTNAATSASAASTSAAIATTKAAEAEADRATVAADKVTVLAHSATVSAAATQTAADAAAVAAAVENISDDVDTAVASAASALAHKNVAVAAANDAEADRAAADASATAAAASQAAAAISAGTASTDAASALVSKNAAATSESNAATSAANASTNATAATNAKVAAETARDTAVSNATASTTARTAAEAARDAAIAAKNAAETAEVNAETAETNAETAQAAAAASQSAAATSATTATTQAGIATTKAGEASTSAAAAAQSAAEAAAAAGGDFLPRAGGTMTGVLTLVAGSAYGPGWSGSNVAVTRDEVYDKIETMAGSVSDTAYAGSWNGVTTTAPSKNAVYDEMELRLPKAGGTLTGAVTVSFASASLTINPTTGSSIFDLRGTASTNDGLRLTATGTTTNFLSDTTVFKNRAGSTTIGTLSSTGFNLSAGLNFQVNGTNVSLTGHSHVIGDVTGLQTALDGKIASASAGAFGLTLLGSATAAAAKASLVYTKSDISLGNVDNTSDANKPISTATQTALDLKLSIATAASTYMPTTGGTFSGDIIVPPEAYGPSWDGSNEAPTKNAVYDEIQTLRGLVVGAMVYQGTWNASTNTPAMPAASAANKGHYYKVSTAGTTNVSGITDWGVGDWVASNGVSWDKIDNTETVSSVAGLTGAITGAGLKTAMAFVKADVGLSNVDNTSDANKPVSTAQQTALDLKLDKTGGTLSGTLTGTVLGVAGASAGISLGDRDLTGAVTLYNTGDSFRIYANSADRFVVDNAGNGTFTGYVNTDQIRCDSGDPTFLLAKWSGTVPTLQMRVDTGMFYFLLSDANAALDGSFNAFRPLSINLTTGGLMSYNGQTFRGGTSVENTLTVAGAGVGAGLINIQRGGLAASSIFDDGNLHIRTPTAMWFDAPGFQWGPAAGGGGWANLGLNSSVPEFTVVGTVKATGSSGHGCAILNYGNTTNTGYVAFYNGAGTRLGYIGNVDASWFYIAPEGGRGLNIGANTSITGTLTVSSTITASSDERLKINIRPLTSALSLVNDLRGVRYEMAAEPEKDQIGVIAQEVEAVCPEFVETDAEGMKSVDYMKMNALLIEAVKELTARVAELEAKVA